MIQNADGNAIELRTFGIEPSGRMLVAASIKPVPVRDADGIKTVPAKLCVFHVGGDGKLELKRQYDVDTGAASAVLERHGHALTAAPCGQCHRRMRAGNGAMAKKALIHRRFTETQGSSALMCALRLRR